MVDDERKLFVISMYGYLLTLDWYKFYKSVEKQKEKFTPKWEHL